MTDHHPDPPLVIRDDPAGARLDDLDALLAGLEHHGPVPAEVAMRAADQADLARWWNRRQAERDPLAGDLTRLGIPGLGAVRVVLDESVPHGTFELRDRDGRRVGGTAPPARPPAYAYEYATVTEAPFDDAGRPPLRDGVAAYMATARAYEMWAAGARAGAPSDPTMAAAVARFAAPRRHDAAHADIVHAQLQGPSRTHHVTYRSHGMSSMTVVEDWQGGHDHPPVTRRPTVAGRPNPCQGLPRTHTGGHHPREATRPAVNRP